MTSIPLDPWAATAAVTCGAFCLRIVFWRPEGHQYKLVPSLMAWVLAFLSGGYGLSVLLHSLYGMPVDPVSPLLVGLLVVLTVQLYRARGNVAALLRVEWERPWSGIERRKGQTL
ncbi:hypothetical protein PSm6_44520 [Pseudomonas solani]|uniref:Phage holin family protein n=2 Tax=Pseudomonas TaxID=286 RepID=A0ABM7LEN2_9PSED|nr:phage holin family protein [Pseudomonas solani]BCD88045.1 hypothetical protein PSm6_44520 [Pseudomonas solani]